MKNIVFLCIFFAGLWHETIQAQSISSFSPMSAAAGASVVITGAGFTGASKVFFGIIPATFVVNSDTQITATVPNNANEGNIAVLVGSNLRISVSEFLMLNIQNGVYGSVNETGGVNTFALKNGKLFGWGSRVGDGTNSAYTCPVEITQKGSLAGKTIKKIMPSWDIFILATDNTLHASGGGSSSFLNTNTLTDISAQGSLAGKTIIDVSSGSGFALALASDGTLHSWGRNDFGQLGRTDNVGTATPSTTPTLVNTGVTTSLNGKTPIKIACGTLHSVILASDGTLHTFGKRDASGVGGLLGDAITTTGYSDLSVAVDMTGVLAGKTIVQIGAGERGCHVLDNTGAMYAWGNTNTFLGTLASLAYFPRVINTPVTSSLNGKRILKFHTAASCVLVIDDQEVMHSWGGNGLGQAANSSGGGGSALALLVNVGAGSSLNGKTIVDFASRRYNSFFMTSDGLVHGVGEAAASRLGNATTTPNVNIPALVLLPTIKPTTEASGMAASNLTNTSATLNWTAGNGTNRIVIVKPTADPIVSSFAVLDGVNYTANTDYAAANLLDGGKIIYNNTGNTVNMSGLSPNTNYRATIFEYTNSGAPCNFNYYKMGSPASVTFSTYNETIWNGTAWSNGVPNMGIVAVLNGNYNTTTNGNITARALVVNATHSLIVTAMQTVNIVDIILNNGNIYNCGGTLNSASLSGNAVETTPTEPTTDATLPVFSAIGLNSFQLDFTIGSGVQRLVVVKANSAISGSAAIDGTTYTADADFSGGGSALSGGKVVFNGTGNSVIVTGLSQATTYFIAIFEYNQNPCSLNYKAGSLLATSQSTTSSTTTWNGSVWSFGAPNNTMTAIINGDYDTQINGDITADVLTINATRTLTVTATGTLNITNAINNNGTLTNCAAGTITSGSFSGTAVVLPILEPTTEATAALLSSIGTSGFTLNFTAGNGASRIVVVKPNSAVNVNALVDGTVYTADANFGGAGSAVDGGKVVYNNTGNSVIITGLSAGTTYHLAVFEYNQNICGTNYKIGSPLNASQATVSLTTWNGTSWDFGAPNATMQAVLNGNYNTNTHGNIAANVLTVNATFTLTTHAAGTVAVTNTLTNNGTINNCLSGTITAGTLAGNAIQNAALEPLTAANTPLFSALMPTNFTFSWTSGSGANRIVVLKANSAINGSAATDGATYTADANFGGAGSTLDGGKVVYNGAGNSLIITGLTAGTTYFVAIFEYNQTVCGTNYKAGALLTTSQTTIGTTTWNGTSWNFGAPDNTLDAVIAGNYNTQINGNLIAKSLIVNATRTLTVGNVANSVTITNLITNNGTINNCANGTLTFGTFAGNAILIPPTEPTTRAGNVFFTEATTNSLRFVWTNGNGNGRIVVLKASATADNAAIDGIFYTANANFNLANAIDGTGKVVFSGTGNTVNVTNLSPNTEYYISIFEYNQNLCSINYATAPVLVTKFTLPVPPIADYAVQIADNRFTATWFGLTGIVNYFLEISTNPNFFPPPLIFNGIVGGFRKDVENLTAGQTYYYRVRAMNMSGFSLPSNVIKVNLPPATPKALEAQNITENSFLARWEGGGAAFQIDVALDDKFTKIVSTNTAQGTATTITKLASLTTYFYRVRSVSNEGAISPNSNVIAVGTALPAPKANVARDITLSSFTAFWQAVQGADNYRLDVAIDEDFKQIISNYNNITTGNVTSLQVQNLAPSKFYYYRLRAVAKTIISVNSNVIVVGAKPDAPIATPATDIKDLSFTANWKDTEGAQSYNLEIGSSASPFTRVQAVISTTNISSAVVNLAAGAIYFYRLQAVNSSGVSEYSNVIQAVTKPTIPQNLKANNVSNTSATISWSAARSVLSLTYVVDIATDGGFSQMVLANQNTTQTQLVANVSFVAGRRYFVRVKSKNSLSESDYSEVIDFILPPQVPILQEIAVDDLKENSFTVRWAAVEGAENYDIEVATNANFSAASLVRSQTLTTSNAPIFNVSSLATYFVRVRANNSAGKSPFSAILEVTTLPRSVYVFAPTNVSADRFTVSWEKHSSNLVSLYRVEYSKNENFLNSTTIEVMDIKTVINLPNTDGGTYFYRVRAVANVSGKILVSVPSNVQKASILGVPKNIKITNVKETSFTVSWDVVEGAQWYEVSIFALATGAVAFSDFKTNMPTMAANRNMIGNVEYEVQVRAVAGQTKSAIGSVQQYTLPPLPDATSMRRLSTTRTTEIEWLYNKLPFSFLSNLKFIVERSDNPNETFKPISPELNLPTNRFLSYKDQTGTQRLQASYRIKVINKGGESIYLFNQSVITSVEEIDLDSPDIVIYPNPTADNFQIINQLKGTIRVFDAAGRVVKTFDLSESKRFDIKNLATGKYILHIESGKQKWIKTLLKVD